MNFVRSLLLAGCALLLGAPLSAQAPLPDRRLILGYPTLLVQAGAVNGDELLARGASAGDSLARTWEFEPRVLLLVPIHWDPITSNAGLMAGASMRTGAHDNRPSLFTGLVVPVPGLDLARRTNNLLSLAVNPLASYGPNLDTTRSARLYGFDFILQTALTLNLGYELFASWPGPLGGLDVYALLDVEKKRGPVYHLGASLPLAPWPR